ncbi:NADPH-dependent FMN reductase [Paenibacillus kandeliae]|uniref:NADPH-dependent FMN reductase n=1 Tax=Paenibacillus kandeliae TaxID=3231269 RepID=UPI0034576386
MPEVLLICGSLAKNAHTLALLEYTEQRLKEEGCTTHLWDLKQKPLPMTDPTYHHEPHLSPDPAVQEFIGILQKADVIVVGSPNYHNSYSGVLKNAIDWMNMDLCRNKIFGLLANGGGIRSTQPLDHLRIVVRGLLGLAIPAQVSACNNDFVLDNDKYVIQNADMLLRMNAFTEQLLDYAHKFLPSQSIK